MTKPKLSPCLNLKIENGNVECTLPINCADENCPNRFARQWHKRVPSMKCLYAWKGLESPSRINESMLEPVTPPVHVIADVPQQAAPRISAKDVLSKLEELVGDSNTRLLGIVPVKSSISKDDIKFFIEQCQVELKERA